MILGCASGPLIGLYRFHPGIIKWCLMHVLHLGLLYIANGGAMLLVCTCCTKWFVNQSFGFQKTWLIFLCYSNSCAPFTPFKPYACMPITLQWIGFLRQVLLTSGVWGSVEESVQVRLHRAYLAFKSWCSRNKIQCSQPAFNQKMVTWQVCHVTFFCSKVTRFSVCAL